MEGMPSGMVISRVSVLPPWRMRKISELLAPLGIRNSPALIDLPRPKTLARVRKASAERTAPFCFRRMAASAMVEPSGTTSVMSFIAGPVSVQPWTKRNATNAATARPISTMPKPSRRIGAFSDHLHDEGGVGPAETEAVVQHRPHLAFLGDMRDQVDALAAFARLVEVQRRRHDLVAQRQDAEDALHRASAAQQEIGRAHV